MSVDSPTSDGVRSIRPGKEGRGERILASRDWEGGSCYWLVFACSALWWEVPSRAFCMVVRVSV